MLGQDSVLPIICWRIFHFLNTLMYKNNYYDISNNGREAIFFQQYPNRNVIDEVDI